MVDNITLPSDQGTLEGGPSAGSDGDSPVVLRPNPEKCLSRVASLSKVDGLDQSEVEILNGWYAKNWGIIYKAGFQMDETVTREFTAFMESNYSSSINVEKVESYLSVHRLLYEGLRLEFSGGMAVDNISGEKIFQRYYYSCRENPVALNSLVVLSNLIWSMRKFRHDLFAIACLVDVMLQAYLAALASFIHLGGVDVLKDVLYDLAQKGLLKDNASLLTKCMDLLDKLDISFKVLQTSKIGIPVNGIASGGYNQRLGMNFECGCDKVKLKATNLIKKWKAIRDASVGPMPSDPKRGRSDGHSSAAHRPETSGTTTRVDRGNGREKVGTGDKSSDPFVLSIINTMVEQKEKEKRRKIEIRNSQMNSKFRSTKSEASTTGSSSDLPSAGHTSARDGGTARAVGGTNEHRGTSVDGGIPPVNRQATAPPIQSSSISDMVTSHRKENVEPPESPSVQESRLASLANFFKAHPVGGTNTPIADFGYPHPPVAVPPPTTHPLTIPSTLVQTAIPPTEKSPEKPKRKSRFSDTPPGEDPHVVNPLDGQSIPKTFDPANQYTNFTSPPQDFDASTSPPWKG